MTTATARLPLARARRAAIGGVCAGVARHLGWPIASTRVLAVALALCGGAGVLLYLWLWALAPLEAAGETDEAPRRAVPVAPALVAATVIAAGVELARAGTAPALALVAIGAIGAIGWSIAFDARDPGRTERYQLVTRIGVVVLLVLPAIVTLVSRPGASAAVLAVALLVLALAVGVAPVVARLWRDLLAERSRRARQEQRAEIAAHLHDSVLQTLALIQNRAGPSSEVARIARAQERELREWLFTGDAPVAEDLVTELRDIAATMELEQAVRIEVVAVGEGAPALPAVVGAAREAMLNAARHSGGTVSVYIECSSTEVDVFVRDRGPGVDLAGLPADRLGIRESILGRMTRAGGSATVRSSPGGEGTEVHLHATVVA